MFSVFVYAATIFLSAMNLFLVQPIIAKQILPWFGGAASVWTTCLFFFQFVLLLGYGYAHALVRLPARAQAAIHVVLLLASLAALPILASSSWKTADLGPTARLLGLLAATVGAPYFLLATTSPLIQSWYARERASPYRLFALSNAASLLGLLAFPFLLEPWLRTSQQAWLWSAGYAAFAVFCALAALISLRAPQASADPVAPLAQPSKKPSAGAAALWVALAALGSLLLVSVTGFIAANVASVPLIWIGPLTLYLVTFILAFEGRRYWHSWIVGAAAVAACVAMLALYNNEDFVANYLRSLPLFLAGLFLACLFCHGQLAELKPTPRYLTFFYLMIALGGALGSLGGSVLAPALLDGDFEMPMALAAVGLVLPWTIRAHGRAPVFAASAVALGMAGIAAWQIADEIHGARLLTRNFYSSLRVVDILDEGEPLRRLEHGGIEHGLQYLAAERHKEPISYYGKTSGVGLAIARQRVRLARPLSIGVIGLGAGVIAAYGEAGGRVRYYEINPQVVDIAKSWFTFLRDTPAALSIGLGDARQTLEREDAQAFDVLAVDAFSGDAIPMHLLTREALAIYRRHLAPGGVLAFHVSNRFVALAPPLAAIAAKDNLDARLVVDDAESIDDNDSALSASDWLLMTADADFWRDGGLSGRAKAVALTGAEKIWTDDFNNLIEALRLPSKAE